MRSWTSANPRAIIVGVTLCRHRFSFKNPVNFFFKSILKDSENQCVLPLMRNAG